MQRLIPDIITTELFSAPALQGLVHDGLLRRVGNWYCPAYLPDTSALRAAAVFVDFGQRIVADTLTAAWIYKAAPEPPWPLTGCVDRSRRSAAVRRLGHIREVSLDSHDITPVGPLLVTSPIRTFRDLCRWVAPEIPNAVNRELARTRHLLATAAMSLHFNIDLRSEREVLNSQSHDPRKTAALATLLKTEGVLRSYISRPRTDVISELLERQRPEAA